MQRFTMILVVGILAFPAIAFGGGNMDNIYQQIDKAQVEALQNQLAKDLAAMDDAAQRQNFKEVEKFAQEAIIDAKELKKLVPADEKIAVINNVPTAKYTLFQAEIAEEFLVLARVMQGKIKLADAIRKNDKLTKQQGFFGWITGHVKQMNIRYMNIAEAFKDWKKCSTEVAFAQGAKVVKKSPQEVCQQAI